MKQDVENKKEIKKCIYQTNDGYCTHPSMAYVFIYGTDWEEARCKEKCEDYKENSL